MVKTPSFIAVARIDGRAGVKPFGSYGASQAGAKVQIGDKSLTVGKDGRVNIPKSIMEKFGTLNKEGRKVIQIDFKTEKTGKADYWKNVYAQINEVAKGNINLKTGDKTKQYNLKKDAKELNPSDSPDFYPEI